jgi:hypothetical protein
MSTYTYVIGRRIHICMYIYIWHLFVFEGDGDVTDFECMHKCIYICVYNMYSFIFVYIIHSYLYILYI